MEASKPPGLPLRGHQNWPTPSYEVNGNISDLGWSRIFANPVVFISVVGNVCEKRSKHSFLGGPSLRMMPGPVHSCICPCKALKSWSWKRVPSSGARTRALSLDSLVFNLRKDWTACHSCIQPLARMDKHKACMWLTSKHQAAPSQSCCWVTYGKKGHIWDQAPPLAKKAWCCGINLAWWAAAETKLMIDPGAKSCPSWGSVWEGQNAPCKPNSHNGHCRLRLAPPNLDGPHFINTVCIDGFPSILLSYAWPAQKSRWPLTTSSVHRIVASISGAFGTLHPSGKRTACVEWHGHHVHHQGILTIECRTASRPYTAPTSVANTLLPYLSSNICNVWKFNHIDSNQCSIYGVCKCREC